MPSSKKPESEVNYAQYINEAFVRPQSGSEGDVMKAFFKSVKLYTISGLRKIFPNDPRLAKAEEGIQRRMQLIETQDECIEAVKRFNAAQSEISAIDSEISKFTVDMMHALVQAKRENYHTMIVIRKSLERLSEKKGFEKIEVEPTAVTSVEILKKKEYFTADVMFNKIIEFYANRGDEEQIQMLTDFVARLRAEMDPDVTLDTSWTPTTKAYPLSTVLKKTKTSEEDIAEGVVDFAKKSWRWIKNVTKSIVNSIQTWTQAIKADRYELQTIIDKL